MMILKPTIRVCIRFYSNNWQFFRSDQDTVIGD